MVSLTQVKLELATNGNQAFDDNGEEYEIKRAITNWLSIDDFWKADNRLFDSNGNSFGTVKVIRPERDDKPKEESVGIVEERDISRIVYMGLYEVIPESENFKTCEVCEEEAETKDYKLFENLKGLKADNFWTGQICDGCLYKLVYGEE